MSVDIIAGDCREELSRLPENHFHCCITSPPYFQQRSYLPSDSPLKPMEFGREKTPGEYIQKLVSVFREVRRVLRPDGTLWIVIDDTMRKSQLVGIPWRLAFALQADGWLLRQDNIWNKPNPTPQSVKDRTTRAHEYVFMFSRSFSYYYDRDAIRTPYAESTVPRQMRAVSSHHKNSNGAPGQPVHTMSQSRPNMREFYNGEATKDYHNNQAQNPSDKRRMLASLMKYSGANKKSVWTIPKGSYKGQHFATFPPKLIEPIILSCTQAGDAVLDPFGGAGTVGLVCRQLGRSATLIELNPDYAEMARQRIAS